MKDFNFNPFDSNVEPMRILDAGCGNGCKMELFKNTQHFVWGVDLSNSVDYAQENLRNYDNLQLVQADINNLPFADGFFDFIYSSGVLIHVPDVEQSLVSLMRKLKRGGTIGLAMAKAISPFALKHVIKESIVSFFRIFTTRLENEDKIMSIVNYLSNLYRYDSRIIRLFVPVLNEDEEWRKCYIHDFLTAKYRKRQKPGKIIKILRKHGFGDIKIFSTNQVSMTAVKK
jgi:ubiquinone/menaquinone biosynthesis C-methylase UbiE